MSIYQHFGEEVFMTMKLNRAWYEKLGPEIAKPYISELKGFLNGERECTYPPAPLVFNAFSLTPYEAVKVVIMGQDPYHGDGQAMGLSFSVPQGVAIPPSLRNIYKELETDLGIPPPTHGCLEKWAQQGVLLLNAILTVRAHEPRSHYGKGWELFTDKVVELLVERKDPLVFALWGQFAQEKITRVIHGRQHPHIILTAAHPSPYSADRFFGCRHFSKINAALTAWGKPPIDWRL